MAKARWGRSELASGASGTKVRWGRSDLAGAASTAPKVRWGRSELGGAAAVALAEIPASTVNPGTIVNLTATLLGGGVADSYTWRRVSGPTIAMIGSGNTVRFLAPSTATGGVPTAATIVIGVTATVGATTSAERLVTITTLPQTDWVRVHGGTWVGAAALA